MVVERLGWVLLHDLLDDQLFQLPQQIVALSHGQQSFGRHHLLIFTHKPGKDFVITLDGDIHALDRLLHQQDGLTRDDVCDDPFPMRLALQIIFDIFFLEEPTIDDAGLRLGQCQIAAPHYLFHLLARATQSQTDVGHTLKLFLVVQVMVEQHLQFMPQQLSLVVVALRLKNGKIATCQTIDLGIGQLLAGPRNQIGNGLQVLIAGHMAMTLVDGR